MSIVSEVRTRLIHHQGDEITTLSDALADAERLADLYAEVRPQPYIVPIERYAGLPVFGETKTIGR